MFNYNRIKAKQWYPVDWSVPPPDLRPISPSLTPEWYPNKYPLSRSLISSFYKCVAMDMLIVMVMCLLINSLQINIVEIFNIMIQEVHVVKVISFNHLAMMYKIIEWFMLMLAPVLWIGLFIMAKKGREILYWWYPVVSREVHIINKRNFDIIWNNKTQEICVNVVLLLEVTNESVVNKWLK